MAGRVFTFDEARALLPSIRERTRRAVEEIEALEERGAEEEAAHLEKEAEDVFRRWAGEISGPGVEVKGPWLVDFDSGAGYYCWRWPEGALDYFHSYEEGFAGRMRIQ